MFRTMGGRTHFTYEMDKKLIKVVRGNPQLYDFSNKKYSDATIRNNLWIEIGKILQKPPEVCKLRWESLRSQYRKVRRQRSKAGLTEKTYFKWKFEDQLEFLRPYMKDSTVMTPIDVETTTFSEDDDDNDDPCHLLETEMEEEKKVIEEAANDDEPDANQNTDYVTQTFKTENSSCSSNFMEDEEKCTNRSSTSERPLAVQPAEMMGVSLMKYLLEKDSKKESKPVEEKDSLEYFFDSIKSTIRTFTDADRYAAKCKIFNVVSEIEGKYVNAKQNGSEYQKR